MMMARIANGAMMAAVILHLSVLPEGSRRSQRIATGATTRRRQKIPIIIDILLKPNEKLMTLKLKYNWIT